MPTEYSLLMAMAEGTKLLFALAFGACVGSLMNVLVYRLPRGLDIVSPPSRCPFCGTRLTWRENIPIFGWVFLGGRCRFCKGPISAEYPIVEAGVSLVFGGVYAVWYMLPREWGWVDWLRPEWATNGLVTTWPTLVLILILISCLSAMTLIDAKTRLIPLGLLWVPAIVGIAFHSLHALSIDLGGHELRRVAPGFRWSIPTPGAAGWWWVGASLGGAAGLLVGNVLVWTGLLRRSFLDYDEWERKALAEVPPEKRPRANEGDPEAQAELWIQYPHARREMIREIAFLAPAFILGILGAKVAVNLAGPWTYDTVRVATLPAMAVPLWLDVMAGALMGYLVAGGVVWGARILATLAFGKEAMGLGDVHLMAGVGACLGWIDPILAFFAAAFIGVFFEVARSIFARRVRRTLAFGPCLALGTILVLVMKPGVEWILGLILHRTVNLP